MPKAASCFIRVPLTTPTTKSAPSVAETAAPASSIAGVLVPARIKATHTPGSVACARASP